MKTLLKNVARMGCVQSSLRSVMYVMPSGPGADFLFDFARMLLMSRGLNGVVLNCVKSLCCGDVGRFGNHCNCVKSTSL